MIVKFSVESGNTFLVDVADMKWKRISKILATTDGAEGVLEEGVLIPQGNGVYNLDKIGKENSGGLLTVGITPIPEGNALTVFVQANVPIQDIDLPVPITIVRAAIVPGAAVKDHAKLVTPKVIPPEPPPEVTVQALGALAE
jgi:hypothetical protein